MSEKYLTNFADQASALSYTSGDTTLVAPQVSLIEGVTELVYSKEIPHDSRIRFAKDETTGKLYFVVDGVYYDITELVKKTIPVPSTSYGEGVDLGLSVKWADRNVGAETPQDNGAYFSWGNVDGVVSNGTTKKSEDYVIEQLIIMMLGGEATPEQIEEVKNNPEMMSQINAMIPMVTGLISGYSFDETTYSTTLGGQFTVSTLDAEHDAATANMGSKWRMPTVEETRELLEGTDQYGVKEDGKEVPRSEMTSNDTYIGMKFVSKVDGNNNSIFFPFAGYCNGSLLGHEGLSGYVWSSSVFDGNVQYARSLYFSSDGNLYGDSYDSRYNGQSVRGVRA